MSLTNLNAVADAFAVHPRTILRIITGHVNPYWAEGYDTDIDTDHLVLVLDTTPAAIQSLLDSTDKALTVHECAAMMRIKEAEFYRKNIKPEWQVGRVKRYSLRRIAEITSKAKA